jgi:hypothetical protein
MILCFIITSIFNLFIYLKFIGVNFFKSKKIVEEINSSKRGMLIASLLIPTLRIISEQTF